MCPGQPWVGTWLWLAFFGQAANMTGLPSAPKPDDVTLPRFLLSLSSLGDGIFYDRLVSHRVGAISTLLLADTYALCSFWDGLVG